MLMAASAIFAMNSCKEDTPVEELDGPSIEWESNSDFSTVDITETMDVNLTIKAPAGIKSFTVDVKSEALESVLGLISSNGSTLDLINDAQLIEGLKTMSAIEGYEGLADLPTGDAILDQTSIDFNISSLVPLILILTQNETEESLHEFTINVTDNNAKTATETCTFRRVASDTPSYAAPTMTWEGNESFDVEEIEEGMIVKFTINVPAGIESLVVDINSSALNPIGISSLDFVNVENNNDMLAGVVTGILGDQDITTATILTLDLSTLMPMLLKLPTLTPDSDHVFTVKLTDKAGQGLEQACTFHYTGEPATLSVDESSVDLWANTVKLNVSGATSVAYRETGTETWIEVKADDNGEYIAAPVWNEGKNDAGLTVYTPETGTGIFAGKTYEFQLNGETVADAELTTASGDVIPNGDMSQWSNNSRGVTAPNAEGESFWDSGNNSMTDALCVEDNDVAKLKPYALTFLSIFACGNLYTGEFDFQMPSGTANFGAEYTWNARPKAFKFKYKSTVGNIDVVGSSDPLKELEGQPDRARVYAVVVDWSERHGVASGMGVDPSSTVWDPATQTSVEGSGNILGYADLYIDTSSDEAQAAWTEGVEIPFNWYDVTTKPSGKYTLVISCTTSYRGDYLTGSSNSELYVDDFEWVY